MRPSGEMRMGPQPRLAATLSSPDAAPLACWFLLQTWLRDCAYVHLMTCQLHVSTATGTLLNAGCSQNQQLRANLTFLSADGLLTSCMVGCARKAATSSCPALALPSTFSFRPPVAYSSRTLQRQNGKACQPQEPQSLHLMRTKSRAKLRHGENSRA